MPIRPTTPPDSPTPKPVPDPAPGRPVEDPAPDRPSEVPDEPLPTPPKSPPDPIVASAPRLRLASRNDVSFTRDVPGAVPSNQSAAAQVESGNPCADGVQRIRLAGAGLTEQMREDVPKRLCAGQAWPAARRMGLLAHSLLQLIAERADGLVVRSALWTGDGQCPAVKRCQRRVVRRRWVDQRSSFVAHRRLRLRTPPSFSNSTPASRSARSTAAAVAGIMLTSFPCRASARQMVETPTPAAFASSSELHPSKARACFI